jgi:hypothetical protein
MFSYLIKLRANCQERLHKLSPTPETRVVAVFDSLDASQPGHRYRPMPGPLRDTKVTDFFQRQHSFRVDNDSSPTSSQSPLHRSASNGNPNPSQPIPVKRKPGRPKGSGKKAKQNYDKPTPISFNSSSRPDGSSGPRVSSLLSSSSPPPRPGTSGTSSKRPSRKLKEGRIKTENNTEEPRLLRSSHRLREIIPPLDPASKHRPRVLYNSPKENISSPQASVPSKRKLDDDDETASITSSSVPLSLNCIAPSPSPSNKSPDNFSPPRTKKRRSLASPVSHALRAPVTPKMARGKDIIPTSQSSEAGLYTPVRPDLASQRRDDVQESVENWRHGRSAYRCTIVSPPRFSPEVDYPMEVDRPLSPLTSCPNTTSLGSSLSSFTDADAIPSDVYLERPPSPIAPHSLPTPSSSSEGQTHGSPIRVVKPPPVRPVTPPPSSPEPEPVPVAPKNPKARTAEIIAEIWANVRAKSVPDSEDSYIHVPIEDELSSEEEDEPFWKRTKTPAR